jgi:hypothetical protein
VLRAAIHPSIVPFAGQILTEGRLGMLLQLADNGTVEEQLLVRRQFLTDSWSDRRTVAQMVVDIAAGLSFLHGLNPPIVHRDRTRPLTHNRALARRHWL